jgi:hypothetical protein
MNTRAHPLWSTAIVSSAESVHGADLSGLNEHLLLCGRGAGRLCALRAGGATLHAFVLARFATTVFTLLVLLAVAATMV